MPDREYPRLEQAFIQTIRRSRRRVLAGRLVGWLADAAVFGLLAAIAFGTWAQTSGLGFGAWIAFFAILGSVLAAHLVRELTRGTSLEAVAVWLDRELGFFDRISSALQFSRQAEPTGFMRAHMAETAAFLESHADQTNRVMAVPWPARGRAFALFLVIGLVSLLPHADRARIEARDRSERVEARRRAGRDLVSELTRLRKEAELSGLTRLSEMVADAEQALSRQLDLVEPEDLEPPPAQEDADGSKLPATSSRHDSPDQALKKGVGAAAGGVAGQGVSLSQVASYQPVGKFDSFPAQSYAEVFAELDEVVIGDDFLTAAELSNLTEHVDSAAGNIGNFGFMDDNRAFGLEGAMRNPEGEAMMAAQDYNAMERGVAGLQYKAFSEFLKRYAAHLGEKALGRAHFEHTQKRTGEGGEVVNVSAPPPKDAEFAIQGVTDKPNAPLLQGTPEQMAQVAAQTLAAGQITGQDASDSALKVRGGGTAPGGKGAGVGSGAGRGKAAPKILPRASGGEYLPLEGRLADGDSVVRLIDARGRRKLGSRSGAGTGAITYREVFVQYARGAEAELNSEKVPLHMRDYIRDYFRAIRPRAK